MRCLDTYALVEIHNGNPLFSSLLNVDAVITDLTLAEFYGLIYRKHDKRTADYWYHKLQFFCKSVSLSILIKAIQFKVDNKKQRFSFFDCVGYIFSLENKMIFVTGDREFQEMDGVEFIK